MGLGRDEFLPKVLEAGTVGGKLVCVIPAFYMSGMVVPKDAAENGCWTVEEFLELAKDYPEAALVKGVDSANVLLSNYCMVGDMPSYINWEEKTCQFNTEAFISLLEMVKSVPMKNMKNQASGSIYEQIQNKEGFFNKEYLTENININNPEDYVEAMEVLKGNGEIAGFPNGEGKPYFLLGSLMRFGMNGASERKDGAWAFLEYLLSEEYQFENTSAQSMFPIRRDAFEERLIHTMKERFPGKYGQRSHSFTGEILTDSEFPEVTEDDREFLRYMADHVYLDNRNDLRSEYRGIISEEAAAFFAGEKTAEEAAGNIQNRVMLFLSE